MPPACGSWALPWSARHCSDDPEEHRRPRWKDLLTRCDAVITSGGVSVGQKDYLPTVLEMLGTRSLFLPG